jgi:hypothetical protein
MISNIKRHIPHWFKKLLLQLYFVGNRYYCNCCNSCIRHFNPGGSTEPVIQDLQIIGAGYHNADYCPVCKATSRDRLVWLYLHDKLKTAEFLSILHIAPEKQLSYLLRKIKNADYRCGDINPSRYQYYAPAEYIDLCAIKYNANTFDLVICNHVLEHIPDDRKAMEEIFRVLKPGGSAILQVPVSMVLDHTYEDPTMISESQRAKAYGQKDHVRIYGKDYPERLKEAGFEVKKISTAGNHAVGRLKKISIDKKEILFVCYKTIYYS